MLSLSATHESLLLASDVNLLKTQVVLIKFCTKFSQLCQSVALFHNFRFDTVCHNVLNEPRAHSQEKAAWIQVTENWSKNGLSCWATNAKTFTLERNDQPLLQIDLANTLNDFFVSVSGDIPQLNLDELPALLPALDQAPTIQPFEVCQKFLALKPFKASALTIFHPVF